MPPIRRIRLSGLLYVGLAAGFVTYRYAISPLGLDTTLYYTAHRTACICAPGSHILVWYHSPMQNSESGPGKAGVCKLCSARRLLKESSGVDYEYICDPDSVKDRAGTIYDRWSKPPHCPDRSGIESMQIRAEDLYRQSQKNRNSQP